MKVKVLSRTSNELKIEIEGVGHTLCNVLQKKLLEDENVELAGYDIPHPMSSISVIHVCTNGGVGPEEVLQRAVKRARELNEEFGKELKKAFKAS